MDYYKKKINIYVPEELGVLLRNDAARFEFFKNDGRSVNNNAFLNKLLLGYYNTYISECRNKYELLLSKLNDFAIDKRFTNDLANSILSDVILPEIPRHRGKKSALLSFKPTNSTRSIVIDIYEKLSDGEYVSHYFARMLMSYGEKALHERERIVFNESVQMLTSACEKQRPISFNTIWDSRTIHEVVPYELAIGHDEMYNYLLCQEVNSETNLPEAKTYRLNRISGIRFSPSTESLSKNIQRYLDIMKKKGAQYPINDDEIICVKLTKRGVVLYNRIYLGRPQYDRIEQVGESFLYYFSCSKVQAYYYFNRFEGGAAEIVCPSVLREDIERFHREGLLPYQQKP